MWCYLVPVLVTNPYRPKAVFPCKWIHKIDEIKSEFLRWPCYTSWVDGYLSVDQGDADPVEAPQDPALATELEKFLHKVPNRVSQSGE